MTSTGQITSQLKEAKKALKYNIDEPIMFLTNVSEREADDMIRLIAETQEQTQRTK